MALTVVIGPPAGGKSTWVLERAKPGDIVVDFDRLAVALTGLGGDSHDHPQPVVNVVKAARKTAIEVAVRQARVTDVYLIHSSPSPDLLARYRQQGAEIVTIDPGRDVVRGRCKAERPRRMFAVIDEWYRDKDGRADEQAKAAKATAHVASSPPVFSFPSSSRAW